jgi:hypothetical protein
LARRARPPAPQPSARALVLAAKATLIVALGVVIAGGLFFVRLLHGPISLAFLIPPIERAIAEEGHGIRVKIADAAVRLGAGGHLEFALSNVRVGDASDTPLAVAPSATVSLSQRALLSGRLAPESVDLISPRLLLFYGEDGALSLAFSRSERDDGERGTPRKAGGAKADAGELGRIDLFKALSEASASARRREHAGAYLRELGLKSATLIIDNGSRRSIWRVPELKVDLDHRRTRSSIAGHITVDSLAGPWTVNFRTFEHENAGDLSLDASLEGLVPRTLALSLPQLALLEGLDLPVSGEAHLTVSTRGEIEGGKIIIDAAAGAIAVPGLANPLPIDGAHLALSYSRSAGRFEIEPSVLVGGDSRVQFTGAIVSARDGAAKDAAAAPGWAYELRSAGGWLGAEPPLLSRLQIDDWSARGFFSPERARLTLAAFLLKVGGGEIAAEGEIADLGGAARARLDGRIGPMNVSVFKALWPASVAPRTRRFIVAHLVRGGLQGGSFRVAYGDGRAGGRRDGAGSLTLEGSNLALAVRDGWPALEAQRALLRLDDQQLEVSVPDAGLALADGRRLSLKGTFSVDLQEPPPRTGRVAVKAQGPLPVVLGLLDDEALAALKSYGVSTASVDGRIDGQVTISLPLEQEFGLRDVRLEGKGRISEGRVRQVMGDYDIAGANITLDMTGVAIEAKGEMLVNGVAAKAHLQHIFDVPADKQPPGSITAILDDADRTQLGLDVNDLVQGEVGVEVAVAQDAGEHQVHVRADLVNAEVNLDSIAWSKPKGRQSVFEFDPVKGTGAYPIELHNVRLVGDNVAIEGWMGIGADDRAKEFRFPQFSLNVVTSLSTQGKLRPDGVWEVTAKGPTYDGRDLFRSFFDVAHAAEHGSKVRPGLDMRAEIDTVAGFSEGTLRNVRMTLQKRFNRLTSLDVRGTQEGGSAFVAVLRPETGQPRRLRAEAGDAGQIFKTIGFYPNAVGGTMSLEVNLDGQGAAERTGTLRAHDFVVLGDPIITSMVQNGESMGQSSAQRVVREQFDFEVLNAPFSVGHGQFVMHNAVINGPLVSASIRGKVDFRAHTLDVGGTYVPMSGLMRVPAELPLFGPLLTGPRGEGVFGMTFAIQGSMGNPQLVMNPLSLITPGILRELFQMTPEDPRVLPRERPVRRGEAARSSSAPPVLPSAYSSPAPQPEVGGGWVVTSEPFPRAR